MTTIGHGTASQFNSSFSKEWMFREHRRMDRSATPEQSFKPDNSFHRSSLWEPTEGQHIEHRHHAVSKTLRELRAYQTLPTSEKHTVKGTSKLSSVLYQPAITPQLPHLIHQHFYGWNAPTPKACVEFQDNATNGWTRYKMGAAQKYNQQVQIQATLRYLLHEKSEEAESLRAQLQELSHAHDHVSLEHQKLCQMATGLKEQVITQDVELAAARQALQTSEAEHEVALAKHKVQLHEMEQQLVKLKREAQQTEATRQEDIALQHKREEAFQQQLLQAQQDAAAHQAEVAELKAKLDTMQAGLEQRVSSLQALVTDKEQQLQQALTTSIRSAEDMKHVIQQTQQDVIARDHKIAALQQEVLELSLGPAGVKQAEQRAHVATLMSSFDDLRTSYDTQAAELAGLQSQCKVLQQERDQLRNKLKDVISAVSGVQMDRQRVQEGLEQEVAAHQNTQMQLALAKHRLQEATFQVSKAGVIPAASVGINTLDLTTSDQAVTAARSLLKSLEGNDQLTNNLAAQAASADLLLQRMQATSPHATSGTQTPAGQAQHNRGDAFSQVQQTLNALRATAAVNSIQPAPRSWPCSMPLPGSLTINLAPPQATDSSARDLLRNSHQSQYEGRRHGTSSSAVEFLAQRAAELSAENATLRAQNAAWTTTMQVSQPIHATVPLSQPQSPVLTGVSDSVKQPVSAHCAAALAASSAAQAAAAAAAVAARQANEAVLMYSPRSVSTKKGLFTTASCSPNYSPLSWSDRIPVHVTKMAGTSQTRPLSPASRRIWK